MRFFPEDSPNWRLYRSCLLEDHTNVSSGIGELLVFNKFYPWMRLFIFHIVYFFKDPSWYVLNVCAFVSLMAILAAYTQKKTHTRTKWIRDDTIFLLFPHLIQFIFHKFFYKCMCSVKRTFPGLLKCIFIGDSQTIYLDRRN